MGFKTIEQKREYQKNYSATHKEEQIAWCLRNPDKQKEYRKKAAARRKLRYDTDATYREKNKAQSLTSQNNRNHKMQSKIRQLIKDAGKCQKCGFSDIRALEIHHHFGNNKKHNYQKQWKEIIEKTIPYTIICANCHAIIHNPRRM